MANAKDRCFDTYEAKFGRGEIEGFLSEVTEMEANSEWVSGMRSDSVRVEAIDGPLFASELVSRWGLDQELAQETADIGTKLVLNDGKNYHLVRNTAFSTLCETAKLNGSALGRMAPYKLAETLNNGLEVARGHSLMLMRYGKASALHSGASRGYQPMPISELVSITENMIGRRFGASEFVRGSNTHAYTGALWELTDARENLLDIYRKALGRRTAIYDISTFIPALRFGSSDTAQSCATLEPVFLVPQTNTPLRFVDGLRIRHSGSGGKNAMELFEAGVDNMFAQFEECAEAIVRLLDENIQYPENTVIGICKKLNIAKKYGEVAREEIERYVIRATNVTAHDIYLCLSSAAAEAERTGASAYVLNNIEDALARVLRLDWREFDVGGTVSW